MISASERNTFALQRVADKRTPVVGSNVVFDPALDLAKVLLEVVPQVDLRSLVGRQKHMMKRWPHTEEEDRLRKLGLRFRYGFDEEVDGLAFVRLHDAVVVR